MAKDKGGHGSEKSGVSAVQARNDRMHTMFENAKPGGSAPATGYGVGSNSGEAHVAGIAAQHGIPTGHLTGSGLPPPNSSTPDMRHGPVPAAGPRYNPGYSRDAVNNAIASSNRSGRRIGGKEASAIHRLLRGR